MMAKETFWIGVGDIHDDVNAVSRLAKLPDLADAAGLVISGDLTIRGGEPQARLVIEAARRLHPVLWAQIGNMDQPGVDAYLTREGLNIHASGRITPQGVGIFGVGWSTPTPFATPQRGRRGAHRRLAGSGLRRCGRLRAPAAGVPYAALRHGHGRGRLRGPCGKHDCAGVHRTTPTRRLPDRTHPRGQGNRRHRPHLRDQSRSSFRWWLCPHRP